MLCDEKLLSGDLICCEGCFKYKPEKAFDVFSWETETLRKYREDVALMEGEMEWYMNYCCRRCRAKKMLLSLEKRCEILEDGEDWDDRKSLGLKKTTIRSNTTESNVSREYLTRDEWYATYHHYERWEDIFAKLGI